MRPNRSSRRELLVGLATGLFGWLWTRTATPPTSARGLPSERWVFVTTSSYDAQGRLTRVTQGPPVRAYCLAGVSVTRGPVTTYSYNG
jgi:hypothetical protein